MDVPIHAPIVEPLACNNHNTDKAFDDVPQESQERDDGRLITCGMLKTLRA